MPTPLRRPLLLAIAVAVAALLAWRTTDALRARRTGPAAGGPRTAATIVQVAPVRQATIVVRAAYLGEVTPEASVDVFARIPGVVESLSVVEGDAVRRGQVVAVLDPKDLPFVVEQARVALATQRARLNQLLAATPSEEVGQAEQRVRQARASLDHSLAQLRRLEDLFQQGYVSQDRVDAARLEVALQEAQTRSAEEQLALLRRGTSPEAIAVARAQVAEADVTLRQVESRLAERIVRAPLDGVVGKRLVNPGDTVTPATALLRLIDIDPAVIVVAVAERDLARVEPGLAVTVRTDALPGRLFTGRVAAVSPTLSALTRTADARIELANRDRRLRAGMFATVEIVLARREGVAAVPVDAVIDLGGRRVVFVVDGQMARARPVQVGLSDGALVEIVAGVTVGEQVVVAGQRGLRDGGAVIISDGSPNDGGRPNSSPPGGSPSR